MPQPTNCPASLGRSTVRANGRCRVVQLDRPNRQEDELRIPPDHLQATFNQVSPALALLADDGCLDLWTALSACCPRSQSPACDPWVPHQINAEPSVSSPFLPDFPGDMPIR